MDKQELLSELRRLKDDDDDDIESAHVQADDLLIAYIGDQEIKAAFEAIDKWYA